LSFVFVFIQSLDFGVVFSRTTGRPFSPTQVPNILGTVEAVQRPELSERHWSRRKAEAFLRSIIQAEKERG